MSKVNINRGSMEIFLVFMILTMLLSSCGEAFIQPITPSPAAATVTPTWTDTITDTPGSVTVVPSPTPQLSPENWQEWPVIPGSISLRVIEIYRNGQTLGNNPAAYSKVGDCESTPSWFMGAFDGNVGEYSLGEYIDLQGVVDHFSGSHSRISLSAGRGFTSASVLSSIWADPNSCEKNESPLVCETRVHNPAFALIMLGTNDIFHEDTFLGNMRAIVEFLISKGIVPILATKADNLEGDHSINLQIATLAAEYDIPLWNFWLVVQPLPGHGLQDDGSHLTWAGPFFDDPVRMRSAWPWRNLTALQILDLVWRGVTNYP